MYSVISLFLIGFCLLTNCNGQETPPGNTVILSKGIAIDSLVILKAKRTLTVFSKSKKIKTYIIALGAHPVGKKQFEGDMKTPEGLYFVDAKSAISKFHKNLNISYPNAADIKYAATHNKRAGGEIKIHGLPNGFDETRYTVSDWTWGCIALTNTEIDELYLNVKLGSPILILP